MQISVLQQRSEFRNKFQTGLRALSSNKANKMQNLIHFFSHFWPMIVFILFDSIGCCIIKISNLLVQPEWLFQINGTIYISDVLHWKINARSGKGQFNFFRTVAEWWLCQRESCHLEQQAWRQLDLSWWRTSWYLEVNTWHVWGSSQRALLGLSKVRWRVPLMLRGWQEGYKEATHSYKRANRCSFS